MLDAELSAFLAAGNSVVVATRDAALDPHATRACAVRARGQDHIVVLLPKATSAQAIADLRDNGELAVCISSPRDFRSVQLKGRSVDIADCSADDIELCREQFRSFSAVVAQFGYSRQQTRNLWLFENWRVEARVTSAYAQTPGPGAGAPLGATRG